MKKGLIVNWSKPSEAKGGMETYCADLAQVLGARLVSFREAAEALEQKWLLGDYTRHANIDRAICLAQYVKQLEQQNAFDYIISEDTCAAFIETQKPLIIFWGTPYLNNYSELYTHRFISPSVLYEYRYQYVEMQRLGGLKAAYNIVDCAFMREYVERLGLKATNVPPKGVSRGIEPTPQPSLRSKGQGRFYGMFTGAFHPKYGLHIVAELVKRFGSEIFWFIKFKHPLAFRPKAIPYEVELPKENVRLFSEVDTAQQMTELMSTVDFLLVASVHEGGCLSATEALTCNTPIVIRKTGYFYEDEGATPYGYVVRDWNVESFYEGVQYVLKHRKEFRPREYALEHFSYERWASGWKDLVASL